MPIELRRATDADAVLHARVYSESAPDEPETAESVLEGWREDDASGLAERYTALVDGSPAGFGRLAVPRPPAHERRAARLEADFLASARSHYNLGHAFDFLEGRALKAGAQQLVSRARESDDFLVLHLRRRGYSGRIFPWWEHDLRRLPEVPKVGFKLVSLADSQARPGLLKAFPEAEPVLSAPALRADLSWLALAGDRVLGASVVTCPTSGNGWIEWAAVEAVPEGDRLPRALEARLLAGASAAGLERVRVEAVADPERQRALEAAGWHRVPGTIQFDVSVADRLERVRIERR